MAAKLKQFNDVDCVTPLDRRTDFFGLCCFCSQTELSVYLFLHLKGK